MVNLKNMRKEIHPIYYPQAMIKCACGNRWQTGSTKPELEIEICSACHPFFTGKDKTIDKKGRVKKFKERLEKAQKK